MAPDGTQLLAGRPQLLGYVPQGFKVYRGEMASSPVNVLAKLDSRIIDFVWKPLQSVYGLPIKDRPTNKLKLSQVKFFGDLAVKSQNQGAAMWQVIGGNVGNKDDARSVFYNLAKKVIALTA